MNSAGTCVVNVTALEKSSSLFGPSPHLAALSLTFLLARLRCEAVHNV